MFVDQKKFFSDQLTFSNIRSRTSRRIYRLALPLRAPETLSSLSKSRIMHTFSICPKDDTITVAQSHQQVSSFSKLTLELALEVRKSTTVAVGRPDNKQNHCRTGEEVNVTSSV